MGVSVRPLAAGLLALSLSAGAFPALADAAAPAGPPQVVVPARTIPAGTVIRARDVRLQPARQAPAADMLRAVAAAVGQEAQRSLYANRPIRTHEVGPVTLVERNARVTLRFRNGPLVLTTLGRALDEGGLGEVIRVMNLDSRRTIYGRITGPEAVDVGS